MINLYGNHSAVFRELYSLIFDGMVFGATSAILALLISPLQYVKIMKQETGKHYLVICRDSYRNYGIAIFFRAAIQYAMLNFVSSASFGISHYFSSKAISQVASFSIALAPVLRSLIGGFMETLLTFQIEIKEINKNKGNNSKNERNFLTIILLVFLRNSLFWLGATSAFELSGHAQLPPSYTFWLTFVFGLVAGVISTPVDALATRICGSQERIGVVKSLYRILRYDRDIAFAGTFVRIVQIILYTVLTEWVMEGTKEWFNIVFAVV